MTDFWAAILASVVVSGLISGGVALWVAYLTHRREVETKDMDRRDGHAAGGSHLAQRLDQLRAELDEDLVPPRLALALRRLDRRPPVREKGTSRAPIGFAPGR